MLCFVCFVVGSLFAAGYYRTTGYRQSVKIKERERKGKGEKRKGGGEGVLLVKSNQGQGVHYLPSISIREAVALHMI